MSGQSCPKPQKVISNYDIIADMNKTINRVPIGARLLANGINIGGYQSIMEMIFPTNSYGYVNMLTDKIKIDHKTPVEEHEKGRLLKSDILRWLEVSKYKLLKPEADVDKVSTEEFEATYNNVYNFFNYLNDGVYLNIWNIAEKTEPTSGGKKKTRRRKKSKRKRKSRRARR
jgi:hypothetical protein